MGSWRKLAGLSWADRRLLARAAVMLAHVKLALPSTAFRAKRDRAAIARDPARVAEELDRAAAVARVVAVAAARVPFRVSCLHRSVVLWRLLSAERIECELELGARTGAGPFEAHAWVECHGVAIGEDPRQLGRYRRFGRSVVPTHGSSRAPSTKTQHPT